ncbi:Solute carrier family 22 member 4 [Liparis tanakae]|uniref:Solute carrier family 22 member 4 n=1 Tax=Liparis tanakae TaxID=230148 RepID=A0A4Z2E6Y2_9TELE|nr:Solute carrier family 22 member 4 [Liparis tanakae]
MAELVSVHKDSGRSAWCRLEPEAGRPERSSCSRYRLDPVQSQNHELVSNLSSLEVLLANLTQEGCKDGWTYSTEHYESTVVTEESMLENQWVPGGTSKFKEEPVGSRKNQWVQGRTSGFKEEPVGSRRNQWVRKFNLVCADQWKQPMSSLVYFLGGLTGCFISGQISDRYVRCLMCCQSTSGS